MAAVGFGVGVEDEIVGGVGEALEAIGFLRDGGEVADADELAICIRRAAEEGDDVL